MPTERNADLLKSLESILELERIALTEGDLDRVAYLGREKEKLINAINDLQVFRRDELMRVQGKVSRNQDLLKSAAEGIRSVADRIAELRRVQQEFSTYGADGQRSGFSVRRSAKLEKRA